MDKLLLELLSPFAGRLVATFSAVSIAFWMVGLAIVRGLRPGILEPTCLVHADLCGIQSGKWSQAAVPLAVLLVAVVVVSTIVLALTPAMLKVLHGTGWWWREPGTCFQRWARNGQKRRAQTGARHRCIRYPHGLRSKRSRPKGPAATVGADPAESDDRPHAGDVALQPTKLGNVFAAAQQRILVKHGLRMNSCRRLLVEVLSTAKRTELEALTGAVMRRVHTMNWFLLTTVWSIFLPGVLAKFCWVTACVVMAHWMYREVCHAAGEYCDALEAIVTVHRVQLYRAIGLPLPESTEDEPRRGGELSGYLDRGTGFPHMPFTWRDVPDDGGRTVSAESGGSYFGPYL